MFLKEVCYAYLWLLACKWVFLGLRMEFKVWKFNWTSPPLGLDHGPFWHSDWCPSGRLHVDSKGIHQVGWGSIRALSLTLTMPRAQTQLQVGTSHTHFKKAPGESCRWKFCYWFCCCLSVFWSGTRGFVWARDLLQTSKRVCVGLIHDDACVSTNRNEMSRPPSRWRNVSKTGWTFFFFYYS